MNDTMSMPAIEIYCSFMTPMGSLTHYIKGGLAQCFIQYFISGDIGDRMGRITYAHHHLLGFLYSPSLLLQ